MSDTSHEKTNDLLGFEKQQREVAKNKLGIRKKEKTHLCAEVKNREGVKWGERGSEGGAWRGEPEI